MSSLLPVLVVVVAGAAITAAAVRRASAGLRWQGSRSQTAISPRAGRELGYLIGWPVLAAGFLLIGSFASDSVTISEHEWWSGATWLAIPLALTLIPSAEDRVPTDDAP